MPDTSQALWVCVCVCVCVCVVYVYLYRAIICEKYDEAIKGCLQKRVRETESREENVLQVLPPCSKAVKQPNVETHL